MGFDQVQGFLFGKPMSAKKFAGAGLTLFTGCARLAPSSIEFGASPIRRRNVDAISRVLGDFVPQCANGYSERARRRGSIPVGAGECFQHEISFYISDR